MNAIKGIFTTLIVAAVTSVSAAAQDLPQWHQVRGGRWEVPIEVAMDAANAIKASAIDIVPKNRRPMRDVAGYTVQYQGVLEEGARLVRLSGACSLWGRTPEQLRADWLVVADGGDCYYDAIYDPAVKRITAIRAHGHG